MEIRGREKKGKRVCPSWDSQPRPACCCVRVRQGSPGGSGGLTAGSPAPGRERGGHYRHRPGVRRRSCGRSGGQAGTGASRGCLARHGAVRRRRGGAGFTQAPRGRGARSATSSRRWWRCACQGPGAPPLRPRLHPAPRFPLSRVGGFVEVSQAAGQDAGRGCGAVDSRGAGVGSRRRGASKDLFSV